MGSISPGRVQTPNISTQPLDPGAFSRTPERHRICGFGTCEFVSKFLMQQETRAGDADFEIPEKLLATVLRLLKIVKGLLDDERITCCSILSTKMFRIVF